MAIAEQIDSHGCAGGPVDGCKAETPATVVVERDGSRRTIEIRPQFDAANDRNRLGFIFGSEPVNPGPFEAAGIAGKRAVGKLVQEFQPFCLQRAISAQA